MSEEMELKVTCPVEGCGTKKKIKVPAYIFETKQFGTLKIQINKGIVCPDHQFVIFVDKKGKIRGTEKIDIQLAVAVKASPKETLIKEDVSIADILGMLGELASFNVFHSFLLDIPVTIIRKEIDDATSMKMNNLLKKLFPDLFESKQPFKFINRDEFKNFKMSDMLVIDEQGYIISSPWEINKFEFEEFLFSKALATEDIKAQIIIFRQEKDNLLNKVKFVQDLIKNEEIIYEEDIKDKISERFLQKKVSFYEIDLIKEIFKFRFKGNLSKIKIRSFDKLKDSLW